MSRLDVWGNEVKTMSCNEIRVDLPAYINNRLSASAHDRVEEHIAACPACRESLASERALKRALQEQFSVPPLE